MTSDPRPSVLLLALLLAACGGGANPMPSADPTDAVAPPTRSPTAGSQPSGEPSAEPSAGGRDAPFSCELPIVEPGTAPIANIVDIRVAGHDGYDRFVIEFEQGTPDFTLDRAEPPFTQDASGLPIEVEGESFLGLVMRGGTKQTDAGTSSYDGPTEFDADLQMLVHAVEAGDFERQSTWYVGLADEACVRVFLLADPARLVIDLEH